MPVASALALWVQEAEGHGAGMQVDATITLVRLRGESPEVSSSPEGVVPSPSLPRGDAEEGASISITGLELLLPALYLYEEMGEPRREP
jgi:hypothetical protein